MVDFKDKVVLITGASAGMGKEIARKISKEGCKIALFARSEDKLEKICNEINKGNSTCIFKKCDVSNKQDVSEAVNFTREKFGRIDIAFLNAGILVPNPIETFDSGIIIKTVKVNFFGMVYFIEKLLPIMKNQKHSVIAVTSTLPDKRGVPGWGAYGSSKAAISWLAESLRSEAYKKYNIEVITIKPGSVQTPMIENFYRPGSVTPEKAAEYIVNGVRRGKKVIQFPLFQQLSIQLRRVLPPFAYDKLPLDMMKGDGFPEPEEKNKD